MTPGADLSPVCRSVHLHISPPLRPLSQVLDYSVGLSVGHSGVGGGGGHLAAPHTGQDMWDMAMITEEGDRVAREQETEVILAFTLLITILLTFIGWVL